MHTSATLAPLFACACGFHHFRRAPPRAAKTHLVSKSTNDENMRKAIGWRAAARHGGGSEEIRRKRPRENMAKTVGDGGRAAAAGIMASALAA